MPKKHEPVAKYVCGLPHCRSIILLPRRSQTAEYTHRDRNRFICNGILVLMELTPEGQKGEMDRMFNNYVAEQVKRMWRPG